MNIAVIAPMEPAAFFDALWEGVWEATFDISPFGIEVQNLTAGAEDLAGQRKLLAGLLDEPVHAIALVPAHASGLNDLIDAHVARGTPVITFHSDAPASRRTLFVGPDAFQAGVLAGEILAKLMLGKGRLMSFPGAIGEHYLMQRYEGLQLELKRHHGRIEEVACALDCEPLQSAAAAMLASHGRIDGIYVGSEKISSIAQCLDELGIRVPCIGFANTEDVQPHLDRGTVSAIIDDSRYQQGYFAVQKAYETTTRDPGSSPRGVNIPCSVIFGSNMRDIGKGQSLNEAFEGLVLQRTESLRAYQKLLQEANAKLESLATTDPLTGLVNRRKFEETLRIEVDRGRRHGSVSLLMMDLNWFKGINDKYGHLVGDEALKTVAQVLQSRCRTTDVCARLGGDEFAVIMPLADVHGAAALRDEISSLIARTRFPAGAEELGLSVSIGAATLPGEAETIQELVALADSEMYRAKKAIHGRDSRPGAYARAVLATQIEV